MFSFLNKFKKNKAEDYVEQEAAKEIAVILSMRCNAGLKYVKFEGQGLLHVHNDIFDIVFTVCKTNKKHCIKIEEIIVQESAREQGICTNILSIFKDVATQRGCSVGLWCKKDDKKNYDYYTKQGFIHVETLNDNWLEFN